MGKFDTRKICTDALENWVVFLTRKWDERSYVGYKPYVHRFELQIGKSNWKTFQVTTKKFKGMAYVSAWARCWE